MNKIKKLLLIFFVFIVLASCSFDNKTGIWKNRSEELKVETFEENTKPIFTKVQKFKEEISTNETVSIAPAISNSFWNQQNFSEENFVPHFQYENQKNLIFRSKKILKKINNESSDFEPLIIGENIILSDNGGNIYNYSFEKRNLIWKFNFYKKRFRKLPIKISFTSISEKLIVSDNLGYFYCLDINSGKIIWAQNFGIPFRSNIKIDEKFVFSLNQDNKFYGINVQDGEKILDLETFPSFLEAEQKTNIALDKVNKNVYFITSTAEVYSISYQTGAVNWIYKVTGNRTDKTIDLFFSSPIVYLDGDIILSTSSSTVSINSLSGKVNWEIQFNTFIRPVVSKNFIFLVSRDGFVINLNKKSGKVIWSKYLFNKSKNVNEAKMGKISSINLAADQIFLTTNKGYFLFLNYQNGEIINYAKADRSGFFSKPSIVNKKIYIINNKGKVLVFN